MRTARFGCRLGGVCPGGVYRGGVCPAEGGACLHPPVNKMTDRCKNIALPQTSFSGGNKENLAS